MPLERYVLEAIEGKRKGLGCLRLLSLFFRLGVALRNGAYRLRLLPTFKVGAQVISVGNISCGGTGKTPFVYLLAEKLSRHKKVAILSRGYRSAIERSGDSKEVEVSMSATECGDEPLWLKEKLPHCSVWVGKDRVLSAKKAIAAGAEVLLLDDGMQYRRLERDVEIVLLSAKDPFGKGYFLPGGFLRDSPSRLKEADLLVMPEAGVERVRGYSEAPLITTEMELAEDLNGRRVALFCAIAHPHRFVEVVQRAGAEVVETLFKRDHDSFSREELADFAKRSRVEELVCTEKDFVKLKSGALLEGFKITPLAAKLKITSGEEVLWHKITG